jgi:hypothetical protein
VKKPYLLALLACLALLAAPAAWASFADPTGAAPFGITTQPDAKGQKLDGVVTMEFSMLDDRFASQARVLLRLRKGSQLGALYAFVAGPLDTEDPAAVQAAVFAAITAKVKAKFFPEECGAAGTACPGTDIVLKEFDEVAITDDGVSQLFVVGNLVLSATQPTK